MSGYGAEVTPVKPPVPGVPGKPPAGPEKPKGPEHNVTLMEEPGVIDLFNKAAKNRALAEKDPAVWNDCITAYATILKKYSNTVYLDKWEGADKDHPLTAYKNGLYKSTRERVAAEIASLPPAGLEVYRVVNESAAKALYLDGKQQFDERKMEQLARDYVQTASSNDAMAWLGEVAYERGSPRDASERLRKAALNPGKTGTPMSVLARLMLAQLRLADKAGAEKTLAAIEVALKDPAKGALQIGSDSGPAAFLKLKSRVEAVGGNTVAPDLADASGDWTTYYGNATHSQIAQARDSRGLRKWSLSINDLLYGKNTIPAENDKVVGEDGTPMHDQSINQQLTVKDGYFYVNNGRVYTAYPIANPVPGNPVTKEAGTAKFQLPSENAKTPPTTPPKNTRNSIAQGNFVAATAIVQHPYFTTMANGRVFGILGQESFAQGFNSMRGMWAFRGRNGNGGDDQKQYGPSNYPVCFGRVKEGGETVQVWSLKPGEAAFNGHSKADQEWLKGAYFVSSPTYESGVLYCAAVVMSPNAQGQIAPLDAWAAAFDADNGQMLWHTQICSATPIGFGAGQTSDVQPDRGLPVAVASRTVYVVTNLGAVAALNAGGGTVKWIRVYDRVKTAADQMGNMGEVATTQEFWAPNPPIVYKNRLIVTPQDSDSMYGYDIETGARVWEKKRLGDAEVSDPTRGNVVIAQGSYKHMLGIVNGALVLTGKDILFVNALNGKNLTDTVAVEGTIKGRGAVTDSTAWISTDKDLLRIGIINEAGAFKFSEPKKFPWTDPKVEAGSIYSAGGVMFTVSHTHINAYIVWDELEAKLLERLKIEPENVPARIELSDIYKSIAQYDKALNELNTARENAAKKNDDGKFNENLKTIATRKFEALMGMGEKARDEFKPGDAIQAFQKAYEAGNVTGLPDSLPVMALKAQAELQESSGKLAEAAQTYQLMIAKHGNAVMTDRPQSSKMARLYAQMKQAELKAKDPASVAAIDAQAQVVFASAGKDTAALQKVVDQFPNSEYAGTAQLTMAKIELEKSPDRARLNAMRVTSRQATGPSTALALAILAQSCERLGLMAAAHNALVRLASNDAFKDVKASLQGIDPKAAAGEVVLRDWAAKLLDEPKYQRAPSQAVFAVGPGKLNDPPAWTKSNGEESLPLIPDGIPPVDMRRAIFTLESKNEISAIGGRDGLDLWKPRPSAPPNSHGRSFWWERLLIICGENTIVAYDSTENGKVAWTQELRIDKVNEAGYWAQINGDRLIVAHSGNILEGLDAATGSQLWKKNTQASQMNYSPVCGNGVVVVTLANSNKLTAFNLETGGEAWVVDVTELSTQPVISGDRVIVAERTQKLVVIDGRTGKRVGDDIALESPASMLRAVGDLAIVMGANHTVSAYRTGSKTPGKAWQIILPPGSTVTDMVVDGDDLLVTSTVSQTKYEMNAFSIKAEGKIKWKQEMAADAAIQMAQGPRVNNGQMINNVNGRINVIGGGRVIINNRVFMNGNGGMIEEGAANFVYGSDGSGGWLRENVARDTLAIMQSNWDVTGTVSKVIALVDRVTGKVMWSAHLKAEMSGDGTIPIPRIQLFDGGIVVSESGTRAGYFVPRDGNSEDDLKNIIAEAAKNPGDAELRVKLATALFDKGDREKGLTELIAILSDSKTTEASFIQAYTQFAALRKLLGAQQHTTLSFQRVDKAPDLAGGATGWDGIAEKSFDSWKDVFLSSEDSSARTQPKKDAWHGTDDLKASFKGVYDDKRLYIQIAVKDDLHKNDQSGSGIDFGDSVKLAFDIDLDGGTGYRGKMFELSLGLGKAGVAHGWRRVENARFLRGITPIEKDFSVTRKEADKTTLYQIALDLNYLGLNVEPGKKFGFTFAAQDLDTGTGIEKSISPSPGLMGREPRYFSQGVLEAKK